MAREIIEYRASDTDKRKGNLVAQVSLGALIDSGWEVFLSPGNNVCVNKPRPQSKKIKAKVSKEVIQHEWEGHAIEQTLAEFTVGKVTIPARYVNLTQMCKANGKQWADYKRLDSTTEYLQALEADLGISRSALLLEIKGGGDGSGGTEQSTWGHPMLATDVAQWVSVRFKVWANRTLVEKMVAMEQKQIVQDDILARLLPATPRPRENHFDDEFQQLAADCTGYRGGWKSRAMMKFLSITVHQPVVKKSGYERLNDINPVTKADKCRRDRKQHQHFSPEVDFMFNERINTVRSILKVSTNYTNFQRNLKNHDAKVVQMTLGNILDD